MSTTVYIDSRKRVAGTDSDFEIDLGETLHIDSGAKLAVHKIRVADAFLSTDRGSYLFWHDVSGGTLHYAQLPAAPWASGEPCPLLPADARASSAPVWVLPKAAPPRAPPKAAQAPPRLLIRGLGGVHLLFPVEINREAHRGPASVDHLAVQVTVIWIFQTATDTYSMDAKSYAIAPVGPTLWWRRVPANGRPEIDCGCKNTWEGCYCHPKTSHAPELVQHTRRGHPGRGSATAWRSSRSATTIRGRNCPTTEVAGGGRELQRNAGATRTSSTATAR